MCKKSLSETVRRNASGSSTVAAVYRNLCEMSKLHELHDELQSQEVT